jgi:hypothetical protein
VNTFICERSFSLSASRLDWRRLGKQRLEVAQMMRALTGGMRGWASHPAVLAWTGHERAMAEFGLACHWEWISRGYQDTTMGRLADCTATLPDTGRPWWIGDPTYLAHVRAVLVAKDPGWYGQWWPGVEPLDGAQWWPAADRQGVAA